MDQHAGGTPSPECLHETTTPPTETAHLRAAERNKLVVRPLYWWVFCDCSLAAYCDSFTFKLDAKLRSPELNLASLVAQTAKNRPMESLVQSLGREESPREGNSNPFQYPCLENSMDREEPGGLQITKNQTRLSKT